jgi:serine/threonine protein kinase
MIIIADDLDTIDWQTRFKIIKGICKGLKYIHEDLDDHIYHLDLKPGNILLDKEMVPKLADFGLSRIFGEELTRMTNTSIGTL